MATGASTADLAVILIDARKGVLTQTRRHAYIVSLLGIRHVVLAVNKIDLVDYRPGALRRDRRGLSRASRSRSASRTSTRIPVSALKGDNVIDAERAHAAGITARRCSSISRRSTSSDDGSGSGRSACRCNGSTGPNLDFRGFRRHGRRAARSAGRRGACACRRASDAHVARIVTADGDLDEARRRRAVTLTLRRRDRHQPRRRASRSPTRRPSVADQFAAHARSGCRRGADAARPPLLLKMRHQTVDGDDHEPQVQGRCQHARARRRARRSSSTRSASAISTLDQADRVRSLCGEPRHRRLHPDRPLHQRDGRRRA